MNYYTPILKWKQGEQQALAKLEPALKLSMLPLIEIVPEGDKAEVDEAPREPRRDAYPEIAKRIASVWGTTPLAVDVGLIDPAAMISGSTHLLEYMFTCARLNGAQAVPVTGIDRAPTHDDRLRESLRKTNAASSFASSATNSSLSPRS